MVLPAYGATITLSGRLALFLYLLKKTNIETVLINRACTDFCVVDRKRTSVKVEKPQVTMVSLFGCHGDYSVVMTMVVTATGGMGENRTYLVSAHSPDCIVMRSSTGELVSKLKVQRRVENKLLGF